MKTISLVLSALLISSGLACQRSSRVMREERRPIQSIESPVAAERSQETPDSNEVKLENAGAAYLSRDYVEARTLHDSIKYEELSSDQKFSYNNLANLLKQREAMAEYDRKMHPTVKAAEREYDSGSYNKAEQLLDSVKLNELSDADKRRRNNLLDMIRNYKK